MVDSNGRQHTAGGGATDDGNASDAAVRRELVECHRDFLHFLRRRLGSPDEAEDVLQDFMARALHGAASLRDVASIRGWLSRVLSTTLIDHYRKRARGLEDAHDPATLDDTMAEPDAELDAAVCSCLYRLLPTLQSEHRDLIWRIDLLGGRREQIAADLGLTVNNLNVKLHRARRALKTRLEEMCLTCPEHGFLDCECDEARRVQDLNGLAWAEGER